MRIKIGFLLTCLLCAAQAQQNRPTERPVRQVSRGLRGAVAAGSESAVEAGMRMYHRGGNAVDAGVAATLAAAVVEYSHFGFGGECPILIRSKDGQVRSIAGVGTMPQLATAEFFRTRKIEPGEMRSPRLTGQTGLIPTSGILPVLVPGMVDAVLLALREFGVRPFADVAFPAIELAEAVPIDETRSMSISRSRDLLERWPTSLAVFLPGGQVPSPGEVFSQPGLARTLRMMIAAEDKALAAGLDRVTAIDAVRDCFYRGEIARKIDAFSRANVGLLRYEDLAAFRLQLEEAATTNYRGWTVCKPGFWSQGPVMLQTLNLLESYDLRAMKHNSTGYLHHVVEALKLAYADRDTYYGDPAFAHVPAERLLSKEYAAERRSLIDAQASPDFRPGRIGDRPPHPSEIRQESPGIADASMARDTTCVTAIDADGLVFSATPSGAWLPSVIAGDTGIPLTQRAQSFYLIPGHPNELAGGKRPRITLSPTLAIGNSGDFHHFLALSTPGGDNQDQALLQVLLNVIEFGMNPQLAIEAPRFQTRHLVSSFDDHGMSPGDLLLDERTPAETQKDLAGRGHKVKTHPRTSSGAAPVLIYRRPNGVIEAAADPYAYRSAQAW